MSAPLKLGSLFDGIGGFPCVAAWYGIEPVWASEIEAAPISITKRHFPNMKHLGDITKINGAEIEPVDIVTFGSPCQDFSTAGKRAGLAGARSGLLGEAMRIIEEMRAATNGLYPTWAIWENVPGALSSNDGLDFRAVLQSFANAELPMPVQGRWADAGMVRGYQCDFGWRTPDAQFWGVPQRRKRVFLVADFRGRRAAEVLFKPESLRGHFTTGGESRQGVAGGTESSPTGTDYLTGWDTQERRIFTPSGVSPTLSGADGGGGRNPAGYVFDRHAVFAMQAIGDYKQSEQASTVKARDYKDATDLVTGVAYSFDSLASNSMKSSNPHSGCRQVETAKTLDCAPPDQAKNQGGICVLEQQQTVRRLTPTECERLQGFPDGWTAYAHDGKPISDSARYKALGNSVALPCVEYLIQGIVAAQLDEIVAV